MTELVVHTGSSMASATMVREQLVAWREPLKAAGVAIARQDDAKAWDNLARQPFAGGSGRQVRKLVKQSVRQDAQLILLSAESIRRPLRKTKNVRKLRSFCAQNDLSCRVVVVVREQLGLLNAVYCRKVLQMDIVRSFESYVTSVLDSGGYNFAEDFGALFGAPAVEVVAIPYDSLDDDVPARDVLREAGLSAEALAGLPAPESSDETKAARLPGPVLIAATRLLHKRLIRLGVVQTRRQGALVRATTRLRRHAQESGWDDSEYWGWSPELAAVATAAFAEGNTEFAARAWGTAWPDTPAPRPAATLDLPTQSPALVVDVMSTIQEVIDRLMAGTKVPADASPDPAEDRAQPADAATEIPEAADFGSSADPDEDAAPDDVS